MESSCITQMFDHPEDAFFAQTKQLGGYVTLLQINNIYNLKISYLFSVEHIINVLFVTKQAWIHEHFSKMGRRDMNLTYKEICSSQVSRYMTKCHICRVGVVHIKIDGVIHVELIWTPYQDHYPCRAFQVISLFLEYIRLKTCSQYHWSKLVLHQFGYQQLSLQGVSSDILVFVIYLAQDLLTISFLGACVVPIWVLVDSSLASPI